MGTIARLMILRRRLSTRAVYSQTAKRTEKRYPAPVKLTAMDAVWVAITVMTAGIVYIAITKQHVPGWSVLPFAGLVFAAGAAWIRVYHKGQ
jgi:hypothetical protein